MKWTKDPNRQAWTHPQGEVRPLDMPGGWLWEAYPIGSAPPKLFGTIEEAQGHVEAFGTVDCPF